MLVTKNDRVGASLEYTINTIRDRLGANPIQMQLPIGSESGFKGMVDLLSMQAIYFDDELGKEPKITEIPADLHTAAEDLRAQMVEKIAELDDDLTLKYLEGEKLTIDEMKASLRRAVLETRATPVFCGSSLRNKGVQLVLDAIVDYLPSPLDIPAVVAHLPNSDETVELPADDAAPFERIVFKIVSDPYVGSFGILPGIFRLLIQTGECYTTR